MRFFPKYGTSVQDTALNKNKDDEWLKDLWEVGKLLPATRRYDSEDSHLFSSRRGNLKFY